MPCRRGACTGQVRWRTREPSRCASCLLVLLGSGILARVGAFGVEAPGTSPELEVPHPPAPDGAPPMAADLGMTPEGIIPYVPRPGDLIHPERWRYIPPGRIVPGSLLDRFLVTSFIGPYAYYTPEVGFGVGAAITDLDFRDQRRQESAAIAAERSTLGEEQYSIDWKRSLGHVDVPGGGVFQEERSWVRVDAGYQRVLTRRFYGFGPDSPASNQTSYTDEESYAGSAWQRSVPRIGDDLVLSLGAQWQHHNLASGHVGGVPSLTDSDPSLTGPVDGDDAGWSSAGIAWDTRDSQHNPYRGWVAQLTLDQALASSGHSGGIVTGLWSGVLSVPGLFHGPGLRWEEDPPTDVLAIGGFVQGAYGHLPFFDLPSLGGSDTLRAYIEDRFTDRDAWHLSAEYRFWVVPRGIHITRHIGVERLGLAPFVDLGSVAPTPLGLLHARLHQSLGIGARAMVERASVFRADLGWWRDSTSVTGGYGLSF